MPEKQDNTGKNLIQTQTRNGDEGDMMDEVKRELGMIGYAFLWLLGRPLGGLKRPAPPPGTIFFASTPLNLWKVRIVGNTWVYMERAPNAFHRGMQRLAFGVRWYCLV